MEEKEIEMKMEILSSQMRKQGGKRGGGGGGDSYTKMRGLLVIPFRG